MDFEKTTMGSTPFSKWSKTEKKKQLDSGEKLGVIFMNLLKAFDRINPSFLLANLKTYDRLEA